MTAVLLSLPPCPKWCDRDGHKVGDDLDAKLLHTQEDVRIGLGGEREFRLSLTRDDDIDAPGEVRIFFEDDYLTLGQARELAGALIFLATLGEPW